MTELPYQTFGPINRVFIGGDAKITTRVGLNGAWVHHVDIMDHDGREVLYLCLTVEAAATLADLLANLADPDPAPWAARDLAHLAAGPDPLVVT